MTTTKDRAAMEAAQDALREITEYGTSMARFEPETTEKIDRALAALDAALAAPEWTPPQTAEEAIERMREDGDGDPEGTARLNYPHLFAPETGAGVPEGWRLVPVEPTREMLKAAGDLENETAVKNYGGSPTADDYWSAMLSAAPTPPQAGGDQGALHDPGPDWVKMPWTNRYIPSSPDKGGEDV